MVAFAPGPDGGKNNTVSPQTVADMQTADSLLESDGHFSPSSRLYKTSEAKNVFALAVSIVFR